MRKHLVNQTLILLASYTVLAGMSGCRSVPAGPPNDSPPQKAHLIQSVSLRKMADSLHAVIAAHRQVYTREMFAGGDFQKSPHPTPAHLLRAANLHIQKHGAEFSYVLRSPWPIDPAQGPQTEIEEQALKVVLKEPDTPHYFQEELGGRSYFTAAYADSATLPACVQCHNQHPRSPKRDFKIGDTMGALIIRIPLEF